MAQKSPSKPPRAGIPLKSEKDLSHKRADQSESREIDEELADMPSKSGAPGEPVSRHDPRAITNPSEQSEPPRPTGP